jgi:hypothetical protein
MYATVLHNMPNLSVIEIFSICVRLAVRVTTALLKLSELEMQGMGVQPPQMLLPSTTA